MVTTNTNDIREISALFEEATARTSKLVEGVETGVNELQKEARTSFLQAVQVIAPVLKYVSAIFYGCDDSNCNGRNHAVRGIDLGNGNILVGAGLVSTSCRRDWQKIVDFFTLIQMDQMLIIDQYLEMIGLIGIALDEALGKVDERREGLAERHKKFVEVARVFSSS